MGGWLSGLVAIAALGFVAVRLLLKPILAFTTTSQADLTRIRANLEGPLGAAGPSMRVVDIVRTGGTLPRRYRDSERSYLVTLRRPGGETEQRTVRIEVALFGRGEMSLDRKQPPTSLGREWRSSPTFSDRKDSTQRADWWWRLPTALRLILVVIGAGLFLVALQVLPALPFISEAKGQLSYVLHRNDIRIVELYSRGRQCGVYTTRSDRRPMRFLIDEGQVWTGPVGPEGVRQDVPYDSADPYDQWSRCVSYSKGGRGDEGFALWTLGLFR